MGLIQDKYHKKLTFEFCTVLDKNRFCFLVWLPAELGLIAQRIFLEEVAKEGRKKMPFVNERVLFLQLCMFSVV